MEALQSSVSVFVPADLSSLHGLYDLSVLSHGLLASHHNLLLHPHLIAGDTQVLEYFVICHVCDLLNGFSSNRSPLS